MGGFGLKAAIIYGPRDLRVEEVEVPAIGPEDVLVRVKACGICGSDVHRYLGTRYGQRFTYPLNSGHEYCGDVAKVGANVRNFKVGDRVTLGVDWFGSGSLGAFSEYIRVPQADRRLHKVPEDVSYEEGAIIEPLLVALNGFSRAKPRENEEVLILGAGPIGLCLLQRCLCEGISKVIVSEVSPRRLELARRFGAITVDTKMENLEERVLSMTGMKGVDVTFECAGTPATIKQALSLTKPAGRLCLIAHYAQSAEIDPEAIIGKTLTIHGIGGGDALFEEAVNLIVQGKIELKPLISHEFPLQRAKEAFEAASKADTSVKVIIKP